MELYAALLRSRLTRSSGVPCPLRQQPCWPIMAGPRSRDDCHGGGSRGRGRAGIWSPECHPPEAVIQNVASGSQQNVRAHLSLVPLREVQVTGFNRSPSRTGCERRPIARVGFAADVGDASRVGLQVRKGVRLLAECHQVAPMRRALLWRRAAPCHGAVLNESQPTRLA